MEKLLVEKKKELDKISEKKRELRQIKKDIKKKNDELLKMLKVVVDSISDEDAEKMVLQKMRDSAYEILDSYLMAQKQKIITYFENLWDKYGVDIRRMEIERAKYKEELDQFLKGLGYEKP